MPVLDGDPSQDRHWAACSKCHTPLQQGRTHQPQDCPDCDTSDHGWRDKHGQWWDAARERVSSSTSAWISGHFDGNYDGVLLAGHADDALSLRSYTFEIREAVLTDIETVAAPPLPIDAANLAPLRLPVVRGVHIFYHNADKQPRSVLADLYDFRLHAWGNASTEQIANGAPVMAGRFWGTAYARLGTPPVEEAAAMEPTGVTGVTASRAADVPAGPLGLEGAEDRSDPDLPGLAQDPERATARDMSPHPYVSPSFESAFPPVTGAATSPSASAAPAAQKPTSMPDSTRAGTQDASTAPIEPKTAADIPTSSTPPSPTIEDSTAPRGQRSGEADEEHDRIGQQASSSTRRDTERRLPRHGAGARLTSRFTASMRGLWGKEPFLRPGWKLFLALAGLLLWLVCGWPIMLLGLGALLLHRLLRLWLFKRRKWPSLTWRARLHPAPLILVALLAFFAILGTDSAARCIPAPTAWITIIGLALLLSALAQARTAAVIIALLWIGGLLGTFRFHGAVCGQTLSQSVRSSVENTAAQIKRQANELVSYDRDAEIVSADAPKTHGQHRISLAQALDDPSRYFSCAARTRDANASPVEIYLGESALFGFNSDGLNAEAEATLQKLAALIAHDPVASIVLTGHTDKLGMPLHNLKLSEQRARRIADWLVAHGVLQADRIDVRGAGDRDPVVDDAALYRMNRRVEMHVDCPDTQAPAQDDLQEKSASGAAGGAP
jgi:outer membrane protein OmpA-like peptidoglycan-associated protein